MCARPLPSLTAKESRADSEGYTEFIYQGPDMLKLMQERDTEENTVAQYTMGMGLEAMRRDTGEGMASGASSFYHYDALGSTQELTDPNETVTDTYRYNAWGQVLTRTGTTLNPHTYVGKERYYLTPDPVLYLLGVRYYEVKLGRFITLDPAERGLNWYLYVVNLPIRGADPSGLSTEPNVKPCQVWPGKPGKLILGPVIQEFWLTAYGGPQQTRSGWPASTWRTVAVHAKVDDLGIPYNSWEQGIYRLKWQNETLIRRQNCIWHEFDVPGTTYRVALDTGNLVQGQHLDLYLSSTSDSEAERILDEELLPWLRQEGLVEERYEDNPLTKQKEWHYYVKVKWYKCQLE